MKFFDLNGYVASADNGTKATHYEVTSLYEAFKASIQNPEGDYVLPVFKQRNVCVAIFRSFPLMLTLLCTALAILIDVHILMQVSIIGVMFMYCAWFTDLHYRETAAVRCLADFFLTDDSPTDTKMFDPKELITHHDQRGYKTTTIFFPSSGKKITKVTYQDITIYQATIADKTITIMPSTRYEKTGDHIYVPMEFIKVIDELCVL